MNQDVFMDTGFTIFLESEKLVSPVSMINYEYYQDEEDLKQKIAAHQDQIQLIASSKGWFSNSIPFGESQKPALWDYADGVDTFRFLLEL